MPWSMTVNDGIGSVDLPNHENIGVASEILVLCPIEAVLHYIRFSDRHLVFLFPVSTSSVNVGIGSVELPDINRIA